MKYLIYLLSSIVITYSTSSCNSSSSSSSMESESDQTSRIADSLRTYGLAVDSLPEPSDTKGVDNPSKVIGWPEDKTPLAPEGFTVTRFAEELKHPRMIYIAPNKDIFVSESDDEKKSANQISILRDTNNDGTADFQEVFMTNLNQPYGMLVLNNYFYVANTDGLYRYPYQEGQTQIDADGEKILELPAGGYNHHWTRNLIASSDNSKIYISVGSASNNGEYGMNEEIRRANILEINPDGSGERIYASGLRNPVGMAWEPTTKTLWTAVNERDEIGDNLVPDYITSVKEGGFYGWPYAYFGANEDPRMKGEAPDLVSKTLVPDVALGAHTSSLGLAFYDHSAFPAKYRNGAFIGQHGSWNRDVLNGYRVLFVPFENGKPSGDPQDFLTGFIADIEKREVYGRPVSVAITADGGLLLSDDDSNVIWHVKASK